MLERLVASPYKRSKPILKHYDFASKLFSETNSISAVRFFMRKAIETKFIAIRERLTFTSILFLQHSIIEFGFFLLLDKQ